MATATRANKELVERVNDGLNEQNPDAFVEHHAPDVTLHVAGEDVHGIDAALEHETAIWEGFPDLHHTLDDVIAEGDRVAYRFTATGTHEGPYRGIEPTGEEMEITGQGFVRIEGDRCAEVWLEYDVFGMMQQLGVVDAPRP